MDTKRSYALDALKLLMAYMIAVWHLGLQTRPDADVIVDIFFMISGFFLARRFYSRADKTDSETPWEYTITRVRSLYPHFLLATVLVFCYHAARKLLYLFLQPSVEKLSELGQFTYSQVTNLTLLQSAYTFLNKENYPVWQISALLIGSYFLYGLLVQNEKLTRQLVIPASVLAYLSLLEQTSVHVFAHYGPVYMPILRAFCFLGVGALTWYFTRTPYFNTLAEHTDWLNVIMPLILVALAAYNDYARIYVITVPIIILDFYFGWSWLARLLNRKCFRRSGNISLAIYLNHALVVRFTNSFVEPRLNRMGFAFPLWQKTIFFILLITPCCTAALVLVDKWKQWKGNKQNGT